MRIVPDTPQNTPELLKRVIFEAIRSTVAELYDASFYRERALDFDTLTRLFLTMDGGSIAKELHAAGIDASASAFVQRREKLKYNHFEKVFEKFNYECAKFADFATFKGHHVVAFDGTCINLDRNPDASTFVRNSSNPRGYNQLHVTPLYDVLNKTYLDCHYQPSGVREDQPHP